jgi:hypothetical protein
MLFERLKPSHLLLLVAALGAFASCASADEIVVEHIRAEEEPIQEFDSPMQLEIPAPWLPGISKGDTKNLSLELRKYVCNDTHFRSLIVKKGKTRKSDGKMVTYVEFEGLLSVRESHDKIASLRFSLVKDGKEIGAVVENNIDAEERKNTRFKLKLAVPAEQLESGPPPTLEILLYVRDTRW